MNLIRLILLSLFIFIQAQADTIYNLIKIPNLEVYEINTSNKLRYVYAKQPFTIGVDNNINCFNSEKNFLDKNVKNDFDKAAEDLRLATRHLGMIVGKVDVEEILGSIFNDFCIGK